MRRQVTWKQREEERKRKAAIKAALLRAAREKISALWAASTAADSGFVPSERKAISAADHALRAIEGGWLTRRAL